MFYLVTLKKNKLLCFNSNWILFFLKEFFCVSLQNSNKKRDSTKANLESPESSTSQKIPRLNSGDENSS